MGIARDARTHLVSFLQVKMACIASPKLPLRSQTTFRSKVQKSLTVRRCSSVNCPRRRSKTAFSDVQLTISGCNALALALGRFVFLPAIRAKTSAQGPGVQNGESTLLQVTLVLRRPRLFSPPTILLDSRS